MFSRLSMLKILNRDAKILVFTRGIRSFSAAILTVSFTIYLSKLGASAMTLGLVFTGMSLFSAVRSFLEGVIADHYGRKPVLLFSAGLMIVGGTIYTFTQDLGILLVTAVLVGMGGRLPYTPAEQAILTEKVSDEDRTKAFSVNSFLGTIAAVLGSLVAGLPELLQSWGVPELISYRPLFAMFFVTGIITFASFTFIEETISRSSAVDEVEATEVSDADDNGILLKWSAVVALDLIGSSFLGNFVSYWFYIKFGVGPGVIGTFFGMSRFLMAFSYFLGLKIAERVGVIKAIIVSRIPVVFVNMLTPILPGYTAVALMRGFMSLFAVIDIPLRQSYLMGMIGSRRRASAAGVVMVVSRFTAAGAPLLTGYSLQYVSISLPFYAAAFFQFLSLGFMYVFFKNLRPPEEQSARTIPLTTDS